VQHRQAHPAGLDDVAVGHRDVVDLRVAPARQQVRRARLPGQLRSPGHVVVVDVRLQDMGGPHTAFDQQAEHPVDVALRVDHHGDLPVVDDVAAVTQAGGLERLDVEHVVVLPYPVGDANALRPDRRL
jgi:hypothetical protein